MDSLSLYLYSHGFSQCWLHKDFHIYFPFCWNSGIHIKYVKQKIVQPSLCRGLRGALWAPLSPLHNDIWVLTIVKTFIIILINEGAQRPPIPPQGLELWSRTTGIFYKILLNFHLSLQDSCLTGNSCTLLSCTVLYCSVMYRETKVYRVIHK